MADETDDKAWIADLECALSEECSDSLFGGGQEIPEGLRPEVWKSCLGVHETVPYFDEIFDLPEQKVLRQDCHQFVAKLGNDDEDKVSVLSDLESILTYHRKSLGKDQDYRSGNGWLELLQPVIALKLPRSETCSLFQAIASRYVPRGSAAYPLFRLLILYHDPKLCSFLDTKRITPDKYASVWFQSLFAATCSLPAVTAIWDLYFQQGDPFFLLFLGLVIIINSSAQILGMKEQPKEKIIEVLTSLPSGLQVNDVQDFCSLAQYYSSKTPGSFRQDLENVLFDDDYESDSEVKRREVEIEQALCLPVSVRELVENSTLAAHDSSATNDSDEGVRFFLVDCRPADEYNAGHLPTAFHLDCNLMLQGGELFNTAVQALLSSKRQALASNSWAGGEHLCFMGCGSLQSDQYTHMVVASFLHSNTHYVTLLKGGYRNLHEYFGETIDSTLADHNSTLCLVCLEKRTIQQKTEHRNGMQSPSRDFLGKLGAAMKLKSAEVKEKLLEYIVNPGGGGGGGGNNGGISGSSEFERHVSPADRGVAGKRRYRNVAPVFSIDDNDEDLDHDQDCGDGQDGQDDSQFEEVTMSSWLKRPEIINKFHCKELRMNGDIHESELLVSSTHVYVLRPTGKKDKAKVVVRRPLSAIAKITCKKQNKDVITFKYGVPEGDTLKILDVDTFLIPKACEATTLISQQIVKLLEKKEEGNMQ